MRTVTYRLVDLLHATINLGFRGENEHTRIIFDAKKVFGDYPSAIPSLAVTPPKGNSYPAACVRDGDLVYWDVLDSDVAYDGSGEGQLTFTVNGVVAKSYVFKTKISRSILPTGEAPSTIDDWITRANTALNEIPQAIETKVAQEMAADLEYMSEQRELAQTARVGAVEAKEAASGAKDAAVAAKDAAVEAQGKAESAQDAVEAAATAAAGSATEAAGSATAAAGSAANAAGSATAAAGSATAAAGSAAEAAGSASQAAAQLALVTAEGEAQVAAVEEKGEEVLESIPSDYSTLINTVNDLENAINASQQQINSAPSEETGQALLEDEIVNTVLLIAVLDNVDYLIAHLPQEETLTGILDELQTETSWIEMIYHEVAARLEETA